MLHVPSICRPCPATALSPFDPPALPIQFEYQQAQLEAEIENLSWKVERADSYDRGDLENQMHIAEQQRRTLLKDFQDT